MLKGKREREKKDYMLLKSFGPENCNGLRETCVEEASNYMWQVQIASEHDSSGRYV